MDIWEAWLCTQRDVHLSAGPARPAWTSRFEGFMMIYPMQIWPFLQVTFIAFGKSSHGQHRGEELAWKQTDWVAERELELGIHQADSRQPSPGQTLREGNSLPTTASPAAPGCKQLLTLSPNRGSFLRLFSWYLAVWMLIPLTKLSPMLFPPSFLLISFSQWEKKRGVGK